MERSLDVEEGRSNETRNTTSSSSALERESSSSSTDRVGPSIHVQNTSSAETEITDSRETGSILGKRRRPSRDQGSSPPPSPGLAIAKQEIQHSSRPREPLSDQGENGESSSRTGKQSRTRSRSNSAHRQQPQPQAQHLSAASSIPTLASELSLQEPTSLSRNRSHPSPPRRQHSLESTTPTYPPSFRSPSPPRTNTNMDTQPYSPSYPPNQTSSAMELRHDISRPTLINSSRSWSGSYLTTTQSASDTFAAGSGGNAMQRSETTVDMNFWRPGSNGVVDNGLGVGGQGNTGGGMNMGRSFSYSMGAIPGESYPNDGAGGSSGMQSSTSGPARLSVPNNNNNNMSSSNLGPVRRRPSPLNLAINLRRSSSNINMSTVGQAGYGDDAGQQQQPYTPMSANGSRNGSMNLGISAPGPGSSSQAQIQEQASIGNSSSPYSRSYALKQPHQHHHQPQGQGSGQGGSNQNQNQNQMGTSPTNTNGNGFGLNEGMQPQLTGGSNGNGNGGGHMLPPSSITQHHQQQQQQQHSGDYPNRPQRTASYSSFSNGLQKTSDSPYSSPAVTPVSATYPFPIPSPSYNVLPPPGQAYSPLPYASHTLNMNGGGAGPQQQQQQQQWNYPATTLASSSQPSYHDYPSYPGVVGPHDIDIPGPSRPPMPQHTSSSSATTNSHSSYTGASADPENNNPPPLDGYGAKMVLPDRPFKCDECVQSFNRNHDLKRHKRIHLAVKPFACEKCGKQFSRKDALRRHWLVKGCKSENATGINPEFIGAPPPLSPTTPEAPYPPTIAPTAAPGLSSYPYPYPSYAAPPSTGLGAPFSARQPSADGASPLALLTPQEGSFEFSHGPSGSGGLSGYGQDSGGNYLGGNDSHQPRPSYGQYSSAISANHDGAGSMNTSSSAEGGYDMDRPGGGSYSWTGQVSAPTSFPGLEARHSTGNVSGPD